MVSFTSGLILFLCYSASSSVSKTSSECWACSKPSTPHVLTCTGGGVIVIQSAEYGYRGGCSSGVTNPSCDENESNRCCKPGGTRAMDIFKPFIQSDKNNLNAECSNVPTCTFKSVRYKVEISVGRVKINESSYNRINYTCKAQELSSSTAQNGFSILSSLVSNMAYTTTSDIVSLSQESKYSTTTYSSNQVKEKGNGGSAAGISIGVILSIGVAVAVVVFAIRRRKQQKCKTTATTTSYQRKVSNAANTAESTPTINAASNTSSSRQESGRYMMTNGKKPQTELQSTNVDNYHQINDICMTSRKQSQAGFQAGHADDYNQIEDSDFLQNKADDGYTHVGITNAALGEDDYHHIGGDNSNNIVTTDDAYNHINNTDIQLDKDDYHHIDVNTTQETVDVEYNHIGPEGQTDIYGYNRFGDIKPEVNDHDNYNHIDNVY